MVDRSHATVPCRSISAAANQWLEDQGGFPLFTLEGVAAQPSLIRRTLPSYAPGLPLCLADLAAFAAKSMKPSWKAFGACAGDEPEPPDHPSAAWDLPVRATQDVAPVSASAAADGVAAEPGVQDGDASRCGLTPRAAASGTRPCVALFSWLGSNWWALLRLL